MQFSFIILSWMFHEFLSFQKRFLSYYLANFGTCKFPDQFILTPFVQSCGSCALDQRRLHYGIYDRCRSGPMPSSDLLSPGQ
jgi:hypothetical protein